METYKAIKEINPSEKLLVKVTDCGFCRDIDAWCDKSGHTLERVNNHADGSFEAVIIKTMDVSLDVQSNNSTADKGTIVMFSGEMDKALGGMIIAQGAQAMGKSMTVFFTFWGLNMLRKRENIKVDKTLFEKMFGFMMPKGAAKQNLSKMNMFGIGPAMIKGRMKSKNVDSLQTQILNAQKCGVKFVACTMSMDLMGIKPEELIDGVKFGGVASYIGDSTNADLTLFI